MGPHARRLDAANIDCPTKRWPGSPRVVLWLQVPERRDRLHRPRPRRRRVRPGQRLVRRVLDVGLPVGGLGDDEVQRRPRHCPGQLGRPRAVHGAVGETVIFTGIPSPSVLIHLLKVEGGAAE